MSVENKYIYFIVRKEKDSFVLGMHIKNESDDFCLNFYSNCKFNEVVFRWDKEPSEDTVKNIYSAIIHSMERYHIITTSILDRYRNIYSLIFAENEEIEEGLECL